MSLTVTCPNCNQRLIAPDTLAELRYYQVKMLLTPAELEPAYEKLMGGAGRGKTFATGTPDDRRAILAEYKVDGA